MKKIIFILIIICNLKNVGAQQNYQENLPFINKAYILTNKIKQIKITDESEELQRALTYNIKGNIIEDIVFDKSFIREKFIYGYNKIDSLHNITEFRFNGSFLEVEQINYDYNELNKIALILRSKLPLDTNYIEFINQSFENKKIITDTLARIYYNELGQKIKEETENEIIEYEWGNPIREVIYHNKNKEDLINKRVKEYFYVNNKLESFYDLGWENVVNEIKEYKYDDIGRLVELNIVTNNVYEFKYESNLVTSIFKTIKEQLEGSILKLNYILND